MTMENPAAVRHPAGLRPEDTALADFPLEEQILVVLAHQPWASASDLARRLDVNVPGIHEACHALEEGRTDRRPRGERDPPESTALCFNPAGRDARDPGFPVQGPASSSAAPDVADDRSRRHEDPVMDSHGRITV